MTQATNKTERFADFINKMNFSEVIVFFNFMMEDMMQIENHAMYDYHDQDDAQWLLSSVGIDDFLRGITNPTEEERAYLHAPSTATDTFCNPWTEILDGYSDWIISHVEDCNNGVKDAASIKLKYPALFDVVREPKKRIKVAVNKVLTKIVEIEAGSYQEACDIINSNFEEYDPLKACDTISDYFSEVSD